MLGTAQDAQAVGDLDADMRQTLDAFADTLTTGQAHFEVWQRDLLARELAAMERLADDLKTLAEQRAAQHARLADLSSRLSLLNLQGLGWLEARLAETAQRLDVGPTANGPPPGALIAEFRQIAVFSQLRNLAHRINEQLRWALLPDRGRDLGWIRADLEKSFQAAEVKISALPTGPGQALSTAFDELAALGLGPSGILDARASVSRLDAAFAQKQQALAQAQARLLGITVQFEGVAEAALIAQTGRIAGLRQSSALLPVALVIALMVLAGVGLSRVVERGLRRRMDRLSDQARALADGRLQEAELISGTDEVAAISRILDQVRTEMQVRNGPAAALEQEAMATLQELQMPMAGIAKLAGSISTAASDALPSQTRAQLELLRRSSAGMHVTLSAALDRTASPTPTVDDADPARALDLEHMTRRTLALAAPRGGFHLAYRGVSAVRTAKRGHLQQVIDQLISNTVTHHDRDGGVVLVQAELAGDRLHLRLVDDGPGISADRQEDLRAAIETTGTDMSRQGLARVNQIVEEAGGEITLISDPQKFRGTAFDLRWPLAVAAVSSGEVNPSPTTRKAPPQTATPGVPAPEPEHSEAPKRRRLFPQAA